MRRADERVVSASEKVREEENRLNARIKWEQAQQSKADAERRLAEAAAHEKARAEKALAEAVEKERLEKWREKRREDWPLGAARRLYREGYTLEHCVQFTGWDAEWFDGALEIQKILDGEN
jgi:hypothetical protein